MKKIINFFLIIIVLGTTKQAVAQPDTICNTYETFHRVTQIFAVGTYLPIISSGSYTQGPPENQTLLYNCFYTIDETTGAFINILGIVNGPGDVHAYGDEELYAYSSGYYPTPVYRQVNFWCHGNYECPNVNQHVPTTNPNNPSNNWSSSLTWIDNAVPSASESTILLTKTTNLNINLSLSGQLLISSTGSAIVAAGVIISNPDMLVRTNGLLQNNGTLKGIGKIDGSLTNNGTISPGNPIGSFAIRDNYTATANAVHKIEIAGPNSNDTIKVGGQTGTTGGVATLNGTLNVSLLNGFIPSVGDTYKIFTFNSSTGVFATESLPALPAGLCWSVHYNPTDVTLEVSFCPAISILDKSITEGNSGTAAMKFKVTLSAASANQVKVNYTTADSTASAPGDYTSTSGTLKFNAGQTSKSIIVLIIGDMQKEKKEKLKLILSQPVNATIADGLGVGAIRNDDAAAFAIDDSNKYLESAIAGSTTIKVSPNPAKEQITVSGLKAGITNYIELVDISGRSLFKRNVMLSTEIIDISNYADGIYILQYYNGSKKQQVKIIKE